MDSLSERIRAARQKVGLTQDELAQALGTHKNTIGRWERALGEPDAKAIAGICHLLGVSPYWLLAGQGPMLEQERDIKAHVGPGTKAGDLRGFKLGEVSGGPGFDTTLANLQARMMQLEQERDEARAALMKAQDNALKAKDETLEILRAAVIAKTKELKDMP